MKLYTTGHFQVEYKETENVYFGLQFFKV